MKKHKQNNVNKSKYLLIETSYFEEVDYYPVITEMEDKLNR